MSTIPCSWSTLHRHSIFARSPPTADKGAQKGQDGEWQVVDKPADEDASSSDDDEVEVGTKKQRVVVRDSDLIVAVGKELRMLNLSGESWVVKDGQVGAYKVSLGLVRQFASQRGRDNMRYSASPLTIRPSHLRFSTFP